jgi:hypothetical protein
METTLKAVDKLIDKFILPMDEDIMEYQITSYDNIIEITFWMAGTESEVEEAIVEECWSVLQMLGPTDYRFLFRFTTEGDNFYEYS